MILFSQCLLLCLHPVFLPNQKMFYIWIADKLLTTLPGTDNCKCDLCKGDHSSAASPSLKY